MKKNTILFLLPGLLLLNLIPFFCRSQKTGIKDITIRYERDLTDHPDDHAAYERLYFLMTNNYVRFSATERAEIRDFLKARAHWSFTTICSAEEPGAKISIKGKVTDEKGSPIANAELFVFQTDSKGYYTPNDSITKSMGEPDPRIFGFLRTDQTGAYELRTIRPASYPIKFQGSSVPQHIHFNIQAKGFKERKIQMVFEDDLAMTVKWVKWAAKLNFPVVKMIYSEKQPFGINNIVMGK